ncbi:Cathepsin Z isoform A [Micractinium conductrix]|uniref:Cathepsin Z isoform A n=1 Tax=Micractinium conductrix TaxID=554055 RepID=A0A2P6VM83_9CHLO|nr:Cathepsin Z isoform A [Micractinium conductrix]|eukprot:PSC75212.1 Cathepsin Z isoform A [Micractinium conductrix]
MRTALALALLLAAAALPAAVDAGCKKRRRTDLPAEELSFNHQPAPQLSPDELPRELDWNDVNGTSMLVPSWNQHIPQYCGSCWLHGTTSMIQDRLKIVKGGVGPDVMLARQVVLNCGAFHGYGQGCDGGDVIDVVRYMKHFGLPDESCQPYSATDHTKYGKGAKRCPAEGYCTNCMPLKGKDTCWPVRTPIRYYVSAYGKVEAPGEAAMMNELMRGPITCSMATYEGFDYGYHRGVATHNPNMTASEVDHDVEVVGWGETDDGVKFWRVRNSWGTFWGDFGFFKIERGVNALRIEDGDCWYAAPTWQDEQDVRSGEKLGTMWGIFPKDEAEAIIPEGHRRPHYKPDSGYGGAAGAAADEEDAAVETSWDGTVGGSYEDTPEDDRQVPAAAVAQHRGGDHWSEQLQRAAYLIIIGDSFRPILLELFGHAWWINHAAVIAGIGCSVVLPACYRTRLGALQAVSSLCFYGLLGVTAIVVWREDQILSSPNYSWEPAQVRLDARTPPAFSRGRKSIMKVWTLLLMAVLATGAAGRIDWLWPMNPKT